MIDYVGKQYEMSIPSPREEAVIRLLWLLFRLSVSAFVMYTAVTVIQSW